MIVPSDDGSAAGRTPTRRPERAVTIVACPDGPLLVRGEALIVDAAGAPVPRRRATVALCRCGASAIKPYCDGSHKFTGFTAD